MAAKVRTLCKEDKASNAAQFCSSKHSEANQHLENRCTRIQIQQKYIPNEVIQWKRRFYLENSLDKPLDWSRILLLIETLLS